MRGAWRAEVPPPDVTVRELTAAREVLTTTNAGPLAWSRVRNCPELADSEAGAALRERYHLAALFGAMQAEAIDRVASLLKDAGIVPLTFKGWSIAAYYPAPHLRPFGDIDLCAPPGRYQDAADILAAQLVASTGHRREIGAQSSLLTIDSELPGQTRQIDLQRDLVKFHLHSLEDVFARSRVVRVVEHDIRVPAAEDHLRLICMHFLLDGGWRPLSLCDVGAVLERLPGDFDWGVCLGEDPLVRHWIATVLKLAHEMLDARIDTAPSAVRAHTLPRWLVPAVLRQWSKPFSAHMAKPRFGYVMRHLPEQLAAQFAARWPDPIRATYELAARFDHGARWPYQAAAFLTAGATFVQRLLPRRAG